ncbi:IS110 family transposase [Klenkia sp. LSe6-5]|uniref:IS110 family transposase n=1 Tax=Klenkia sesuvii TaxID=3103137 RepID=A0ABU8DZX0_9ACTN
MTTIADLPAPAHLPDTGLAVVGGVDTHADTHTAAVIDTAGRLLGHAQFPTTCAGYAALLAWLIGHGLLTQVGVEGTGAYGAGLARHLTAAGVQVIEVDRPDRKTRRFAGKSDPIDAEAAARAVLAGRAGGTPKTRTGSVEAIRVLRVARTSAVTDRAHVMTRIKSLLVTAPADLRATLAGLTDTQLIRTCAGLRPDRTRAADPTHATKIALRSLARRHTDLTVEIGELDAVLDDLVAAINPALIAAFGVGTDVAGQLLVTAGDNPARLHSEAAFAALCGVAPVPASSGKTTRHRLNRGGDRQANSALYRVVLVRLRYDERTRAYRKRRTEEGLSTKEIIRCLKRLIARELYYLIINPTSVAATT